MFRIRKFPHLSRTPYVISFYSEKLERMVTGRAGKARAADICAVIVDSDIEDKAFRRHPVADPYHPKDRKAIGSNLQILLTNVDKNRFKPGELLHVRVRRNVLMRCKEGAYLQGIYLSRHNESLSSSQEFTVEEYHDQEVYSHS